MNKKFIIVFILSWILIKLFEYYFVYWFLLPFLWIGLSLIILFLLIIQIIKLIINRKNIKRIWIINISIFTLLLFLNINKQLINKLIENIDWKILYSLRKSTVEKVIGKELNPNVEWNNFLCKLPFKFPIISNGGNDIVIYRYNDNTVTVYFYIFNGFFEWPITVFLYTNNNRVTDNIEKYIQNNSSNSWKLKENWYRLSGKNIDDKICIE